jgi:hypothetical protein
MRPPAQNAHQRDGHKNTAAFAAVSVKIDQEVAESSSSPAVSASGEGAMPISGDPHALERPLIAPIFVRQLLRRNTSAAVFASDPRQ